MTKEVIRHGKFFRSKQAHCYSCGCEFTYERDDCIWMYGNTFDIHCPECNKRIRLYHVSFDG